MSYFEQHGSKFKLQPEKNEGNGLRKCQLGAVWALKSFFTTTNHEISALVSLPTGAGKTALMMAACFELGLRKILIVVPSKILRQQLCMQFSSLQILKDVGCLPDGAPGLKAKEISKRIKHKEEWVEILKEYDVIVAHPNSISPYYKELCPLPANSIDAVFMDEAHHEPATTWNAINDYYRTIKRIFFTATPFRRDRKRMQAKLAYHYPLEIALKDNILRPVVFKGSAAGLTADQSDDALIHSAIETILEELKTSPNAALLIRTDEVVKAENLLEKYQQAEPTLKFGIVHSKNSDANNAQTIQSLRDGKLNALVCVGIASEGLDIPNLKVAVLHATPRSIPYTIQFLGRISRPGKDQKGSAILIANTDEVKGQVSRLYRSDQAWDIIIPGIIDKQLKTARHYSSAQWRQNDFEFPELNVFFSVLVYQAPSGFQFASGFETQINGEVEIVHTQQENPDSALAIITGSLKPLDWSSRILFTEDVLDVHLFYHNPTYQLVFELTTSEKALRAFRSKLITSTLKPIPYGRLFKVLSIFKSGDYIMVGMKNAVGTGASQPAYKTLIGTAVQSSIRASEGRTFGAGHALLRLDEDNAWGIATKRGRIWAMRRGSLSEWQDWCDELGNLMQGPPTQSIPNLGFLATNRPVSALPSKPMAAILDDWFFRLSTLIIQVENDTFRNVLPIVKIDNLTAQKILECTLEIDSFKCQVTMDLTQDRIWKIIHTTPIAVRADHHEQQVTEDNLEQLLNDYPPTLVMQEGNVIIGNNEITPNRQIESLPSALWVKEDWSNCKITKERYDNAAPANQLPVINAVVEKIKPKFNPATDVLVLDDGSHEISDLVWFDGTNKIITFVHCKPSSKDTPGCRVKDSDILFAQALRCVNWISSTQLLNQLNTRLTQKSNLVLGTKKVFYDIRDDFAANAWKFRVVLAQPGFDHNKTSKQNRKNNNVYELAIPVYERIISCGAEMEIWCY
ncbi:DEAD/DEAH box helicase family protein [uncultured Sphingobacterium sp.]|uniref:DEAD/DEAH box helicase n=1 Tax=uncultured Sphingobacterium sp. TaxID=182688 RepID=UPI0025E1E402|nr:DEAD/DEAH box helicase family protein [uncultured Sphingobacterium sp.]